LENYEVARIEMCSSKKYLYSLHRRDWYFLGGGGSLRPKNLKKCTKLDWNFQRGGEVLEKIPSVGEVWIFSGTTQYLPAIITVYSGFHYLSKKNYSNN